MDWFLYDNGLRHERVKHAVSFTKFPDQKNLLNLMIPLLHDLFSLAMKLKYEQD